jgi:acyl-CoA reductase-like NAD-dependent aldehyde dehydrogenase
VARSRFRAEVEATTGPGAGSPTGDGAPAAAEDAIEVRRPTDGSLLTHVPIDPPERVREVVARVRAAQPEWEAIGFAGRRRWLAKLRDWLFDNEQRIADVMQAETGKVRADADLEAPFICDVINFYGQNAERYLADETPSAHMPALKVKRLRVVYRPYQVVGNISPWNFPLILSFDDSIVALMAGCAVVIKPSELTPLTAMEVVRAWKEEIGGPDVLDIVNGIGDTGGALVDACDFIQFTGSERTGKIVMKRAAETLTPVSLELGGKDPMIVLRDANIERAVNGAAYGGLLNTGQICLSIERVYVEEPVYDEFVSQLAERVRELRQGADDGSRYEHDVGAMTSPNQTAIVSEHVADARAKGARILTGGRRREPPGEWYEPTVIADADHSMKVMTEETFGPVIPVMKVRDADEALRLANDSTYGLASSIFTRDFRRGEELARRVDAGAVNVDDVLTHYLTLEVPMGGWKSSGIGYRHSAAGIRKFCRMESIVSPRFRQGNADPLWFPRSPRKQALIRRAFRLMNARGWRRRLGL